MDMTTKPTISIGQFIGTIAILLASIIGWGVHVEARLASQQTLIEQRGKMEDDIVQTQYDIINRQSQIFERIGGVQASITDLQRQVDNLDQKR